MGCVGRTDLQKVQQTLKRPGGTAQTACLGGGGPFKLVDELDDLEFMRESRVLGLDLFGRVACVLLEATSGSSPLGVVLEGEVEFGFLADAVGVGYFDYDIRKDRQKLFRVTCDAYNREKDILHSGGSQIHRDQKLQQARENERLSLSYSHLYVAIGTLAVAILAFLTH